MTLSHKLHEGTMGLCPMPYTRDLWGSAPCPTRGIYGALPHAPPTFLKKVGEKQCFYLQAPRSFHSCGACRFFLLAAAVSRCNLRGRARKNNVFCFSRTNARLCGINSTAQTKTKIQIKKAVKQSLSFCNFANQ